MTTPHHTTGDSLHNPHEAEARERWGDTAAWKQSRERMKSMSKEDMARIQETGEDLTRKIAAQARRGADPASPEVQALIALHYEGLRAFYDPSLPLYRGLGDMYVADPRFTQNYDKHLPGLAAFMRTAMHAYCDARETR